MFFCEAGELFKRSKRRIHPITSNMKSRNGFQWLATLSLVLLSACASTGTPSGGPKDETPPKLLTSMPLENSVNSKKQRIEIIFDELIALKSPSEKIIVSPPQKQSPLVKSVANKAVVVLSDSLLPNTTYSIDFTDAIVDYNEGNKYGDYAFSFSTGDHIDSLRVSGNVIDASNLNPIGGIIIGTHSEAVDSCFRKKAFERITKSTKDGRFTLKGLPEGVVGVYALGDKNRDYKFDQPGESIAFPDSMVCPFTEPCLRNDTVWKDTITVDTIYTRTVTCFKPDNLVFRYFTEDFGRQYLAKKERSPRNKINLTFGYKSEKLPKLTLIGEPKRDWYILEENPTKDTLTYWITDTLITKTDTLRLQLDYQKTDSLNQLIPATDTLTLISRTYKPKKPTEKKKQDKLEEKEMPVAVPISHLALKSNLQAVMEIYCKPYFELEEPVEEVAGTPWQLYVKKDTIWNKTPFTFSRDTNEWKRFTLEAKWQFETEYKFEIDSGTVKGIYGKTNNQYSQSFKIRAEEDYSRLIATVSGLVLPAFAELLDKSDKVIRRERILKNVADFKFLAPGTYYLRVVEDRNNNFKWDTGNYAEKLQPEQVYYNPRSFSLRANWDVKESWNVHELPILEQKPKELLPKEKK
jgi:hypothetical protein